MRRMALVAIAAMTLYVVPNAEARFPMKPSVKALQKVPHNRSSTPLLYGIHRQYQKYRNWTLKRGGHPYAYHYTAERIKSHAYRLWIYRLWWTRAHYAHKRYRAWRAAQPKTPWPSWWYPQAMCIHHYEASWTNPTGIGPSVSGGMQIGDSEWRTFGGLAFAARAYLATPTEQLTVAWRYYAYEVRHGYPGWAPWPNTAALCRLPH